MDNDRWGGHPLPISDELHAKLEEIAKAAPAVNVLAETIKLHQAITGVLFPWGNITEIPDELLMQYANTLGAFEHDLKREAHRRARVAYEQERYGRRARFDEQVRYDG